MGDDAPGGSPSFANPPAPADATPLDYGVGAPEASRLRRMLRAFAHRNYRLFFCGQFISLCGTFISQVAIIWVVYSISHEAWVVGLTAFVGQIPMLFVGPFAGVWVDRLNRRPLLIATQAMSMVQSLGLAALVFAGVIGPGNPAVAIGCILGLVFFQGLVNAFDMPARQAFLIEMIGDRRDLPNAIALNSTMVHMARLGGPAIAGLLIYWVGPAWCFTLDGLSYLAVIASLLMMRVPHRSDFPPRRSVLHELREGLSYAWDFAPIRGLLLLMAVISIAGMPALTTLMPIYAHHFGGPTGGSRILGFLMGLSGLGALCGAIYLAARRSVVGLGGVISFASAIFGLALITFSFSRTIWFSMAIVPLLGWAMLMNFASANTLLQTLADEDKRGRVMSLFTIAFIGVAPLGNLLAGALASKLGHGGADGDLHGASWTLMIAGAVCLCASAVFVWKLPALRRAAHPTYVRKGLISQEEAAGIGSATEVVSNPDRA